MTVNGVLATYSCGFGAEHTIPGDDIRVLNTGDGDFLVACDCSSESLQETDARPHPSEDHFAFVDGREISAADWLALDALADGWYDADPWEPPEGYTGTREQRRQRVRENQRDRADAPVDKADTFSPDDVDVEARTVPCPSCGADAGEKCQRPSEHTVKVSHDARIKAAEGAQPDNAESGDSARSSQAALEPWTG